jgi:hypothetical protein
MSQSEKARATEPAEYLSDDYELSVDLKFLEDMSRLLRYCGLSSDETIRINLLSWMEGITWQMEAATLRVQAKIAAHDVGPASMEHLSSAGDKVNDLTPERTSFIASLVKDIEIYLKEEEGRHESGTESN